MEDSTVTSAEKGGDDQMCALTFAVSGRDQLGKHKTQRQQDQRPGGVHFMGRPQCRGPCSVNSLRPSTPGVNTQQSDGLIRRGGDEFMIFMLSSNGAQVAPQLDP